MGQGSLSNRQVKKRIKLANNKIAFCYDRVADIPAQVNTRLADRLSLFKINPRVTIDFGSGTGMGETYLRSRFKQCQIIELDIAENMLRAAREKKSNFLKKIGFNRTFQVMGDVDNLPFCDDCADLVWATFVLEWASATSVLIGHINNILRQGGLFFFATLGPDTLKELRECCQKSSNDGMVNDFTDMHHLGDQMLSAGMSGPVVDTEYFTVEFDNVFDILKELKNLGSIRKTPSDKRLNLERIARQYEHFRNNNGRLPATFEVVYGHAWAGLSKKQMKHRVLRIEPKNSNEAN